MQPTLVRRSDGRAHVGGDPPDRSHAARQAGAAAPKDFSPEGFARITAELAKSAGVDLVVGFSMGAVVAYEMVVSGAFTGPVVLLGISLSASDEPRFFRAIIRLGSFLGTLPMRVLKKGLAYMAKHALVPPERQAELQADFARNNTHDMLGGLQAYDTEGRLSGPRDRRSRVGHGRGRASTSA